jgi:hypothetical protein
VALFVLSDLEEPAAGERREARLEERCIIKFSEAFCVERVFEVLKGESEVEYGGVWVMSDTRRKRRARGMLSI